MAMRIGWWGSPTPRATRPPTSTTPRTNSPASPPPPGGLPASLTMCSVTTVALARDKIFRVSDEFGVRAGAQFIEIHALAFSLDRYSEGADAIQGPIQAIG